MPTVITIANQKGGVGKTSAAMNIASILGESHRVLLIDADPQGNSTDTYCAQVRDAATLFDVILDIDDPLPIMDAIQKTESGDIIASDPLLRDADVRFPSDGNEYFRLKDALAGLHGYNFVVIDTGPADNKILKNCLVASDLVIIPITADRYSIQGLSQLSSSIAAQQMRNNPSLKIAGLLLSKYKRRQILAKEVRASLDDIASRMGTRVFNATIRECAAVQKAQARRTMLSKYDPRCTALSDYRELVAELLQEELDEQKR